MDSYHLCVATAKIKFSDIYWSIQHQCFTFDIVFEEPSTKILPERISNPIVTVGNDVAEDYLKHVKKLFSTARISEGNTVSILFTENQVLAIGAHERDLWIDIRNGVCSCPYPKSFPVLDIEIKSLEVY